MGGCAHAYVIKRCVMCAILCIHPDTTHPHQHNTHPPKKRNKNEKRKGKKKHFSNSTHAWCRQKFELLIRQLHVQMYKSMHRYINVHMHKPENILWNGRTFSSIYITKSPLRVCLALVIMSAIMAYKQTCVSSSSSFLGQKWAFGYQFRKKDLLEKHISKSCNLENPKKPNLSAKGAKSPPCALLFPLLFFLTHDLSPDSLLTISTFIVNLI